MLKSDPFLLSAAELATAEAMRADGTIPQDWRYIDIPWQHAAIFDKIVEIGGADMRVLDCGQRDEKKCGKVVFGPGASKRINERALEIRVLFKIAAYKVKSHAMAIEEAAWSLCEVRLRQRVHLHALIERCSCDSGEVIAKGFAAGGGPAEALEFLLNLA